LTLSLAALCFALRFGTVCPLFFRQKVFHFPSGCDIFFFGLYEDVDSSEVCPLPPPFFPMMNLSLGLWYSLPPSAPLPFFPRFPPCPVPFMLFFLFPSFFPSPFRFFFVLLLPLLRSSLSCLFFGNPPQLGPLGTTGRIRRLEGVHFFGYPRTFLAVLTSFFQVNFFFSIFVLLRFLSSPIFLPPPESCLEFPPPFHSCGFTLRELG